MNSWLDVTFACSHYLNEINVSLRITKSKKRRIFSSFSLVTSVRSTKFNLRSKYIPMYSNLEPFSKYAPLFLPFLYFVFPDFVKLANLDLLVLKASFFSINPCLLKAFHRSARHCPVCLSDPHRARKKQYENDCNLYQ